MAEEKKGHKNEKVGEVVSTKMTKTIIVQVSRRVPHPLYKRIITKRKKFYAHDEESRAKLGDVVRIIECRPLSKLKRWRLGEVVRRAAQVAVHDQMVAVMVMAFVIDQVADLVQQPGGLQQQTLLGRQLQRAGQLIEDLQRQPGHVLRMDHLGERRKERATYDWHANHSGGCR